MYTIFFIFGGHDVLFVGPLVPTPVFGLPVTSVLIFKARVDSLHVLSPAHNRFLRFTFGEKTGNFLMAIIAAEPFWSTYFFKQWWNSNSYYSVWQTGAPTVWITPTGLLSQEELSHRPSTQQWHKEHYITPLWFVPCMLHMIYITWYVIF